MIFKSDVVGMDDIVEVEFEEDGEVEKYKLVTSIRGNSRENRVSASNLRSGKPLKGHRVVTVYCQCHGECQLLSACQID